MALNSSGPISLAGATVGQSIALELSQSATGQISLNDAAVRALAGVPSGAITMPTNFYGKSAATFLDVSFTGSPIVTTDGNYKVARYNGSGNFIVNSVGSGSVESNTIQYFIVGGGGIGGVNGGGGGGAGGVKRNTTNDYVVTARTYQALVGAGSSGTTLDISSGIIINVGPGGPAGRQDNNGTASSGPGGGGGGGGLSSEYALPTSGGAAATSEGIGGPPIQAFAGGTGSITLVDDADIGGAGGGGGNTGVGGAGGGGAGGNGGGGITTTITGSSLTFAGGGGGAGYSAYIGLAPSIGIGSAGGGNGGTNPNVVVPQQFPTNGAANSGSGGGGGGSSGVGNGGSGVIIIRWRFQ